MDSEMTQNIPVDYVPILIQLGVAVGFGVVTIIATHLLGPKVRTENKLTSFESGVEVVGNARQPFSVKYFLVAILFVIFDIEVIFMYPWAVNFREFGMQGLIEMFIFMGLLLLGFFFVIKKNALDRDEYNLDLIHLELKWKDIEERYE